MPRPRSIQPSPYPEARSRPTASLQVSSCEATDNYGAGRIAPAESRLAEGRMRQERQSARINAPTSMRTFSAFLRGKPIDCLIEHRRAGLGFGLLARHDSHCLNRSRTRRNARNLGPRHGSRPSPRRTKSSGPAQQQPVTLSPTENAHSVRDCISQNCCVQLEITRCAPSALRPYDQAEHRLRGKGTTLGASTATQRVSEFGELIDRRKPRKHGHPPLVGGVVLLDKSHVKDSPLIVRHMPDPAFDNLRRSTAAFPRAYRPAQIDRGKRRDARVLRYKRE